MRCWKLPDGSILPVGDLYVPGYEDIPLTHELGAKQWLRDNDPVGYEQLGALLNDPENEDQREATIAFMQKRGWTRVGEEHLDDGV